MVHLCERAEAAADAGRLRFEIQVETPQSILSPDGSGARRPDGARVRGPVHRACTTGPTTTRRSAGSPRRTRAWPIRWPTTPSSSCRRPPPAPGCGSRTARPTCCRSATPAPCGTAGRCTCELVRRSLERGYYQGWDLHPAQLPTRYAATFAFYRDGLADADATPARLLRPRGLGDPRRAGDRRGRSPTTCCGRSTAARRPSTRWGRPPASTPAGSQSWHARPVDTGRRSAVGFQSYGVSFR